MSETIPNSSSLGMESEGDSDSSHQNITQTKGKVIQGSTEGLQEGDVPVPSSTPHDNAKETKDTGNIESEECSEMKSQHKQNEDVKVPVTSHPNNTDSDIKRNRMDMENEECGVMALNAPIGPDIIQDKETAAVLSSQSNIPHSDIERNSLDMNGKECVVSNKKTWNSPNITCDKKITAASSSQPNIPTSDVERNIVDMDNDDCSVTNKNTHIDSDMTQHKEATVASFSQPASPNSDTERSNINMDSEECVATDEDTQDSPYLRQDRKVTVASSSQPDSPNSDIDRNRMVMDSADCGVTSEKTQNSSVASSCQLKVLNSDTEKVNTVMESEDCDDASKNSLDITLCEATPMPSPAEFNSENSLNITSEGCDGTINTEPTVASPVEATLPLSSQLSSNDNTNIDESYATTKPNTSIESGPSGAAVPSATQSSITIGSPSTESDSALVTPKDKNFNITSFPEASISTFDQKGNKDTMTPRDSSLQKTSLPTKVTAPEKKCQYGEGENKGTKTEQKLKRGVKRKTPSASKGIQTSIHLLDSNSFFRDRTVDLPVLKREAGVVSVEDLQNLDVAFEEWPMLLVSQLKLRDTIIESLNNVIRELVGHGQVLEQDVDYLKLKILELQQEAKKKVKESQLKSQKTHTQEAVSQTTEEDLAEAWSRWYYGLWGDYYSECDPTSSSYWPGHYTQQSTVPSRTKGTIDKETQQNTEKECQENAENIQTLVSKEEKGKKESKNEDSSHCIRKSDDTRHIEKRKKLKAKRKKDRHKNDKSSKEQTVTEGEQEMDTEKSIRRRKKAEKKRDSKREDSDDNTQTKATAANTTVPKEDTTNTMSVGEMNGEEEVEKKEGKERSHGWDTSESITQQVAAVAAQAVVESGYVFQEELGLYYDYNTGYYYNAENGLYYDTKSGTYFYYDHNTQSYQFHSQVSPSDTTNTKRGKKKKYKKGKSKSSSKNDDSQEKEEGECTESDNEQENEKGNESEEEGEEEGVTSPDHLDEESVAAADVPPSLRLMVVEGGERVRVGELHVVTLNGGIVGRESTSAVHLPDLSISKVHAEIEYCSTGPDDHHYFIRDLGSNNGTFVNNVRLSEARQTSNEVEVGHGWEVQFGSVKVRCHLHPGTLTCNECEPGLVLQNLPSQPGEGIESFKNAKCKEKARRKALKAMQKKYKLTQKEAQAASSAVAPGYTDRTLLRQTQKGSDNPYEKTEVASSEVPLRETNRGFTLLQKMGWSQGQGLGKDNTGRKDPIQQVSVVGKAGLGSSHPSSLPPPDPRAERKKKQLQITQQRFSQQ